MPKPDEEFLALLAKSQQVALLVANALTHKGHHVRILPGEVRPSFEERMDYVDDGDLEVTMRVEVKHRPKLDFSSLESFPHKTVIVDEAYKADKKHPTKIYCYVIVNAACTAALIIGHWTKHRWTKVMIFDGRDNEGKEFYVCPRELAQFWDFADDY